MELSCGIREAENAPRKGRRLSKELGQHGQVPEQNRSELWAAMSKNSYGVANKELMYHTLIFKHFSPEVVNFENFLKTIFVLEL